MTRTNGIATLRRNRVGSAILVATVAFGLGAPVAAVAQDSNVPNQSDEKTTPPAVAPQDQESAKKGVIKPENDVDPGMVKTPPNRGVSSMRVIPPDSKLGRSKPK